MCVLRKRAGRGSKRILKGEKGTFLFTVNTKVTINPRHGEERGALLLAPQNHARCPPPSPVLQATTRRLPAADCRLRSQFSALNRPSPRPALPSSCRVAPSPSSLGHSFPSSLPPTSHVQTSMSQRLNATPVFSPKTSLHATFSTCVSPTSRPCPSDSPGFDDITTSQHRDYKYGIHRIIARDVLRPQTCPPARPHIQKVSGNG